MKDRADVLLVYPVWVQKGGKGALQRMLPPLGILSIASHLEAHGLEVHVVDVHAEALSPAQFREIVRALRPRAVGVSVLSPHYVPAHHIAWICKEEVPDTRVYAGGVHAEVAPEQMLRHRAFDAVCRGDGEETMRELVQGAPYETVLGLSYRRSGTVVHNPPRPVEQDLDRFPFPAYHLIDFDNYCPPVGSYRDLPAVNVLMTRGCPGRCSFCNSARTGVRSRSVEKMVELVERLRCDHGVRQLYFYDDTFTANPAAVLAFCRRMIERRVDVRWICYVRGDMFNDSMAALMAEAGCHQVLLGVESGSLALMERIGKPIRKEKYIEAVKTAHRHGMEVRVSFIIGHLAETRETLEETLQLAKEMDADLLQLSVLTPYPGTELFKEAKARGLLLHEDYARYGQNEVVLKLEYLSADDIIRFERRALQSFYLRPRAIWRQISRLASWRQARDLLEAFDIIVIKGLRRAGSRARDLEEWLEFDVEAHSDPAIRTAAPVRLTHEVRHGAVVAGCRNQGVSGHGE